MWTILVNNFVFTSPTVDYSPGILPSGVLLELEPLSPREIKLPLWAMSAYPQLGFCAFNVPLTGPILGRLDIKFKTLIHQVGTGYSLIPSVVLAWQSLESALLFVSNFLLSNIPVANHRLLPLDFKPFPPPSRFGYTRVFDTHARCSRAIVRSREAFVPLMAMCTMAIAIWTKAVPRAADAGDTCPAWAVALKDRGVDVDWIADLMASPIANLSKDIKRVGVLVRAAGGDLWWNHLPTMAEAHVPIWILWGSLNKPYDTPHATRFMRSLVPSKFDIQNAKILQENLRSGARVRPPVELGSGQIQGETWQGMFARRARENTILEQGEAEDQRERRLAAKARSEECLNSAVPPKSEAVFEWISVSGRRYKGSLVRHRVHSWQVGDAWARFPAPHKRYDDVRREWDLCSEFQNLEQVEDIAESEEETPIMYSDETDVVPSAESCKDVVRQAHAAHRVDTPSQAQQRFADSEDMLRGRYGFVSYPAVDYTPKFPVMTQARVEHLLGFAPGSLPAQNHTPVSDLLGAIIQNSTQGLTNVCTIRHSSTAMSRSMVRFHIVRRKHVDGTIEEVYVIKTRHPSIEPLWDLVITDPVTVVQLLRMEEDHTIPYLVHHLVTCGISCSTAVTSNEPTIGLSHYPFPGARRMETLGWISKGHKFTHEHYRHYEFIRNMLLERDYSRAALLAGGIVGRLAKEALGVSSGTTGPSLDVYEYGSWQEYEGGAVRGDDKLSEEEQDLICGLYKVYTDDSGKQTEDASWWPKQSVWLRCGLYTGFWSADCEAWYQARSNAITTQQAQPKNAAAWKDTLKYYQRDSRIILANKTAACAQYLRNLRV